MLTHLFECYATTEGPQHVKYRAGEKRKKQSENFPVLKPFSSVSEYEAMYHNNSVHFGVSGTTLYCKNMTVKSKV